MSDGNTKSPKDEGRRPEEQEGSCWRRNTRTYSYSTVPRLAKDTHLVQVKEGCAGQGLVRRKGGDGRRDENIRRRERIRRWRAKNLEEKSGGGGRR
jgi:hypothetical protein